MKSWLSVGLAALLSVGVAMAPLEADARRLGGGGAAGMKRTMPDRPAQQQATPQQPAQGQNATPAQQQAPAAGAAATGAGAAAAQGARRSWMAPLAGLAAGLGLAALMSHLGLGPAFANFLTLVLLLLAAFFVIRFLMRRFAPAAPVRREAWQGAHGGAVPDAAPMARTPAAWTPAAAGAAAVEGSAAAASPVLPAGFDCEGFERIAKLVFIRMQAANDAGDLDDLRRFTTPEMFAAARLDLQERAGQAQQTDVLQLDAEVVDFTREDDREIVSVRYRGLVREESQGAAEPFDEIWHLVRPVDGSRDWAIAGIQQTA
ncbi:MAG TPA: Tim44-like domain-containing protein [Burkholderiaceae bacterium]|nr:Tim44-like domain-containing protein [Burkholderiaceae bacterium]